MPAMIHIEHRLPPHVLLGIVRAEGLLTDHYPEGFDAALTTIQRRRKAPIGAEEEAVRLAVRDMLRNGRYKPTGRGKPASEYLLRAVQDDERAFPRINAPVDICNLISLDTLLPVSLWDLDLARSSRFRFRLGLAGDTYVFNEGGQTIDLEDLIVGCRVAEVRDEPIVNPVKDSLATKTTPATTRVAACVYAPREFISTAYLGEVITAFGRWLAGCGDQVRVAQAFVRPDENAAV